MFYGKKNDLKGVWEGDKKAFLKGWLIRGYAVVVAIFLLGSVNEYLGKSLIVGIRVEEEGRGKN